MLIAQISDFHLVPPGTLAYGRVDTGAMLGRAVAALNRLNPQPDAIVLSGDLVQSGAVEEYAELRRRLAPLRVPLVPVAGNHDARPELLSAFADILPPMDGPFVQYVRDLVGLRLIVLDTITPGSDDASFCADRAAWFDQALARDDRPTLLIMHHPPFMTGIPWMDPPTLAWTDPIAAVIDRSPVRLVGSVCGHIHRAIHTMAFGAPVSSCPSTAHQVAADFGAQTPMLSTEAPAYQLHGLKDGMLTTYTVSLERSDDIFGVN